MSLATEWADCSNNGRLVGSIENFLPVAFDMRGPQIVENLFLCYDSQTNL